MLLYILTRNHNDYDQHGEYFVAAYTSKPTFKQLKELLGEDDVTTGKLLRGGGRQGTEYVWFKLHEYNDGDSF